MMMMMIIKKVLSINMPNLKFLAQPFPRYKGGPKTPKLGQVTLT